ncbi:glycosyltransferase family 2 protein [Plantactinospora sp. KBS50]|uniref:glycosyltransferase family 2 protein n=1 Tax=Plantactinospora sp. KBS50 TaxID=2024580 RepID=UPI000BAAD6A6|nr:glycosyltransferase family 2 protein [Plantactinospora sp. KBS50]ASW54895.1 glycosyl transferase [Plantactinospora sp. KBS50]
MTAAGRATGDPLTVSVVVPTRDRPELLDRALRAIAEQDHPGRIEVLVVFDRSEPDHGLERTDPHRAVRVLRNARTPGLAGARNTGIEAATGDLVAFCDDDDEWLPGKLTAQVAMLEATDAELVCCGIRVRYDDHDVDRTLEADRITLDALLRDRLTELHPSTFLIRRSVLLSGIGPVDEEIPGSYAEDYEFLLRAARRRPLANVREPYTLVRWHRRSYFAQRWNMIAEALQWLLERYPEFARQPAGAARIAGQIAFAQAASGNRRDAVRWARRTLADNPREPRAYLALAVASRAVRPDRVVRELHKRGRGI